MGNILRMLFWFVLSLLYTRSKLIEFGSWEAASDDARWRITFGMTISSVGLFLTILQYYGIIQ